jgi:hypothetical protein
MTLSGASLVSWYTLMRRPCAAGETGTNGNLHSFTGNFQYWIVPRRSWDELNGTSVPASPIELLFLQCHRNTNKQ